MRALLLLLLSTVSVFAHPMLQNSMWVVFAPDRVRVAANVSMREIVVAQELNPAADGTFDPAALETASEKHGDYVLHHLMLQAAGHDLPGKVAKVTPPVLFGGDPEQTFYQYELEYPLPAGGSPKAITFRHEMLREWPYAPGQAWDVTYALRMKRSDQDDVHTGLLRTSAPQEFSTGWPGAATATAHGTVGGQSTFLAYLEHGIMHILTGWDHLLFVTALVLATVTFWEMFKVIAAFTLAHTLTLAISVLTGFRLPDHIVEPIIAGSIVFVAVQNFIWPNRSHGWVRLAVAFGFGLVHGLGFAGGLRDALSELGTSTVVLALIAFSIGVEIGHQVVVLPTFGLLKLGSSQFAGAFRPQVLRYGSVLIALAGTYYLVHALKA